VSRGYLPRAAIAEAKEYAARKGYEIIDLDASDLPFDFMISRSQRFTLVRVRRFRYRRYETGNVAFHCQKEIGELQDCRVSGTRELWVRGPERTWHRYRVGPEGIKRLGRWEVRQTAFREDVFI
jgi:hypothetical protein